MTLPLHLGDDQHFRTVRDFLDGCGYTTEAAAERMGLARLEHLGRFELCDVDQRERNLAIRDPLGAIVCLFLAGRFLEDTDPPFLPPRPREALQPLPLVPHPPSRL